MYKVMFSAEIEPARVQALLEAVRPFKVTIQLRPMDEDVPEGAADESSSAGRGRPRECAICGIVFTANSNAAKNCPSCRSARQNEAHRREAAQTP